MSWDSQTLTHLPFRHRPVAAAEAHNPYLNGLRMRICFLLERGDLLPSCYRHTLESAFGSVCFAELSHSPVDHDSGFQTKMLVLLDGHTRDSLENNLVRVCESAPQAGVALLTQRMPERAVLERLYRLPLNFSLLPMEIRLDHWLLAIRLMLEGHEFFPATYARQILMTSDEPVSPIPHGMKQPGADKAGEYAPKDEDVRLDSLTPREMGVLELVAEGKPNKLIANDLDITEHTVKLHLHKLMGKLQVSNRTEAAAIFAQRTRPSRKYSI